MEGAPKEESSWANPMQKACLETVAGLMPMDMPVASLEELEYGVTARAWIESLSDPDRPEVTGYEILTDALVGHLIVTINTKTGGLSLGENGEMMVEECALEGESGARFVLAVSGIEAHPFTSSV